MKKFFLLLTLFSAISAGAETYQFGDKSNKIPDYSDSLGYGYELRPKITKEISSPFLFSVKVPDGNYTVTVKFGSKKAAASTTLRAESRRLLAEDVKTKRGETKEMKFTVNKRSPRIDAKTNVLIKEREKGTRTWDDLLTLEVTGAAPAVQSISVEPADSSVTTVYLCGNSTVVDQAGEPWASWGQMIPRWFDENVAIANHAESGLATSSFIAQRRLDQIMSTIRKGDWVIVEFGHNDQKENRPGSGAYYNFSHNLKIFIDRVRSAGGNIVFVTPTQRRAWEADGRTIRETHRDYPQAMVDVAARENVPVIDLHLMTRLFFETLGNENSKRALVHYPANTFPNQPKPLADDTHFNTYGAYEVAKMVVMGMKQIGLPELNHLRPDFVDYDPTHPDITDAFVWYPSVDLDLTKPDGN